MKRVLAALAVITLMCGPATAVAQKRPDFSGTWVEDESQRKSPHAAPSAGGAKSIGRPPLPLTVTQTPDRITIERTFMGQVTRMAHDFDGHENVNRTGAQVHTTRSRWEGGKFVTEGTIFQVTSQGETSWKLEEVRWMTPKGEMVVERTQVDEDGVSGTIFRVYRRK